MAGFSERKKAIQNLTFSEKNLFFVLAFVVSKKFDEVFFGSQGAFGTARVSFFSLPLAPVV